MLSTYGALINIGALSLASVTLKLNTQINNKTTNLLLAYLMLMGITKPGSKVPNFSQIKLTNTDEGPSIPSLSKGLFRVRFLDPLAMSMGLSASLSRRAMDPTTGRGSPTNRTRPIISPTGRSSGTKKVSEDAPFSK